MTIGRRMVLKASTAVGAPWLVRARAQTRARRIGSLYPHPSFPVEPSLRFSTQAASEAAWRPLGWIEGETLLIERRYAAWRMQRMPELADELLRKHGVELLMALGPEAAAAAARATRTVPIVFIEVILPIECGLIDSYARPGQNCTGLTWSAGCEAYTKQIEFARTIAPSARRIAFLSMDTRQWTRSGQPLDVLWCDVADAAKAQGFDHTVHTARSLEDVDTALAEAAAAGAQASSIRGGSYQGAATRVADFALRQRWVTTCSARSMFDVGLLLCYSPSNAAYAYMIDRLREMASRILRGANPAEMPVEQATGYELALNLKTARTLGLTLPKSLLLRADRVVE